MTTQVDRGEIDGRQARHSSGPKTTGGKSRSRFNAVKHGCRARSAILPGEDPQAFEDRLDAWIGKFRPADPVELYLVERRRPRLLAARPGRPRRGGSPRRRVRRGRRAPGPQGRPAGGRPLPRPRPRHRHAPASRPLRRRRGPRSPGPWTRSMRTTPPTWSPPWKPPPMAAPGCGTGGSTWRGSSSGGGPGSRSTGCGRSACWASSRWTSSRMSGC